MQNVKVTYTFTPQASFPTTTPAASQPAPAPAPEAAAPRPSFGRIVQHTANGFLIGGLAGSALTAIVAMLAGALNPSDSGLAALIFGGMTGMYAIPGGAAGGALIGGVRAALGR